MDAIQFSYWLKGWVELGGGCPSPEQWQVIVDHLNIVHKKETPLRTLGPIGSDPFKGIGAVAC